MKLNEDRFKSILDGTATNLTAKEILIRRVAFDAERRGDDPRLAVEAELRDVAFVKESIAPPSVLPSKARKDRLAATVNEPIAENSIASKQLPSVSTAATNTPAKSPSPNAADVRRPEPPSKSEYSDKTVLAYSVFCLLACFFAWELFGPPAVLVAPIWIVFVSLFYRPFGAIFSGLVNGWPGVAFWIGVVVLWLLQIAHVLPG